jgi:uncharacterized RDD family membrane protein YckC
MSNNALLKAPGEEEGPRFVGYAGFVSRLMAMVVDMLIIFAIWIVSAIALSFIAQTSSVSELIRLLSGIFTWVTPLSQIIIGLVVDLTSLLGTGFLYFTFFYSFGGASIGKHLMGLRVVRADGRPLRPARAALRTLAYVVSMLLFYAGFLNVLVDDRRRAWHDILNGTVVVHSWRAYPGAPDEEA